MPNDVLGNLFIEQGAFPPYTEATRTGNGWYLPTAITGFAPVAAVPTVTAAQEIYNNTPGLVLAIDTLHAFQLTSTAATQTYSIWAMVTTQKAAPTNGAQVIFSNSGRASYTTVAGGRLLTAAGTTVVANGWRPFGSVQAWGTAAATPGNGWHAEVNGRLLVPYGCSFCYTVAGSIATATSFVAGVSWYEIGVAVGSAGNLAMVV